MSAWTRLWALRRDRPVFTAVTLATVALLLVYPGIEWVVRSLGIAQPVNYQDFTAYARAVDAWQSGEPLYVAGDDGSYWGEYLYPPVFLLVFWPFTLLAREPGAVLWGVLSVGLLWVALQLVVRRLGVRLAWWERLLGLWLLVGFHPLMLSVKMGQTGGFLAAVLSLAFAWALVDETPWSSLSGVATAFVGTFKLAYAPVGAHLLCDRRRFAGAVGGGLGLLALSVAVFGVESHLEYLDVLAWGFQHGRGEPRLPTATSWAPPYYRQLHWLPAAQVVRGLVALGVALAALFATDADREVFALGVATFLLITPLPYVYYFVAVLPAVLGMLAVEFEEAGYPTIPVVSLLLLQVHAYGLRFLAGALPRLFGGLPGFVYPLLQPGLWGVLLLFGLTAYRVAQSSTTPELEWVTARLSE